MKNFLVVLIYAVLAGILVGSAFDGSVAMGAGVAFVVGVGAYIPVGAHSFASGLSIANYVPSQTAPATQENMGGYGSRVLILPVPWVESVPALNMSPTTPTEMVVVTTDIVMKEGFYAIDGYTTRDQGEANPEGQGSEDNTSFNNKGSFYLPDVNKVESAAQARFLQAVPFIVIYPCDNGEYKMFGSIERPCYAISKGKSGKKASDANGFTIEWSADSIAPGIFYRGALPLDPTNVTPS